MPVTVKLAGNGPNGAREKQHQDAGDVELDDGHLIVTAGQGRDERTVAVYAPGVWQSAEVATDVGKAT